jgi:hypothetical protein
MRPKAATTVYANKLPVQNLTAGTLTAAYLKLDIITISNPKYAYIYICCVS